MIAWLTETRSAYRGFATILGRYWRNYGRARAIWSSPYAHLSALFTLALFPFWSHEPWWNLAISIIPSVLGFSLGGYAIWLGLGDDSFRTFIMTRSDVDKPSPYMVVSAAFAHFIIIQIAAILGAVIAQATQFTLGMELEVLRHVVPNFLAPVGYGIGFFLFSYALLSALATALAVFRVASWFDKSRNPD